MPGRAELNLDIGERGSDQSRGRSCECSERERERHDKARKAMRDSKVRSARLAFLDKRHLAPPRDEVTEDIIL